MGLLSKTLSHFSTISIPRKSMFLPTVMVMVTLVAKGFFYPKIKYLIIIAINLIHSFHTTHTGTQ